MAKYEYDFVPLEIELMPFVGLYTEGHQEIIRTRAENGWIYDGWIPTKQQDSIRRIDLVFRREIPENK